MRDFGGKPANRVRQQQKVVSRQPQGMDLYRYSRIGHAEIHSRALPRASR